jgi:hypothetical protein
MSSKCLYWLASFICCKLRFAILHRKIFFPRETLVGKMAKLLAERLRKASWILDRARDFHIFHTDQAGFGAHLSS